MNKNKTLSTFILMIMSTLSVFSQQKKYEISPLLNGVGLNTIFGEIDKYSSKSQKIDGNTLAYHRIEEGQITFLGNDVTEAVVSTKNDLVEFIAFIIEKKEIETPQFSEESFDELILKDKITEENAPSYRKSKLVEFYIKNSPKTQKAKEYLTTNYKFISEDDNCQFDCSDKWESDYAKIFIEKNNYFVHDMDPLKVYIDQTLIIRSTSLD